MSEEVREAVIVEWQPKSPFGFGQAGGERIFLHISNFIDRERWPETGDRVSFVMGVDPNGRPCAQKIMLRTSGALLGWRHIVELLLLLALPAISLFALNDFISPWWIIYCVTFTSWAAGTHLWFDKRFAITERSRIPEASLHLFELMGGGQGRSLVSVC